MLNMFYNIRNLNMENIRDELKMVRDYIVKAIDEYYKEYEDLNIKNLKYNLENYLRSLGWNWVFRDSYLLNDKDTLSLLINKTIIGDFVRFTILDSGEDITYDCELSFRKDILDCHYYVDVYDIIKDDLDSKINELISKGKAEEEKKKKDAEIQRQTEIKLMKDLMKKYPEESGVLFADSEMARRILKPTKEEIEDFKKYLDRIPNTVKLTENKDGGFDAEVKDLDLSKVFEE